MSQPITVKRVLQYLLTGIITVGVSTTCELTWRLAQIMGTAKYFVLSVIFAGAALTVVTLMLVIDRRIPRVSMKLFQAAISVGFMSYYMPSLTTFYSMSFMPPGVSVMVLAIVPLWLWVYGIGDWRKKVPGLLVALVGCAVFFYGANKANGITAREVAILLVLIASSFMYATGIAFIRKLFWMHYGLEINFWAMAFAAGLFALTSFLFAETRTIPSPYYLRTLLFLVALSVVNQGLGTFFYRYVASNPRIISTMTLTLGVPILGVAWSWLLRASGTPLNPFCIVGMVLVLAPLALVGIGEPSGSWMTHFLTNNRRIGERVVCHVNGFVKIAKGTTVAIEVIDLSIGGVGFLSEQLVRVGDIVLLTLPLGQGWTQISVDAKVTYAVKAPKPGKPGAFIWHGGLMFVNIPEERLQPFVEFVASVGKHHHEHPHQEEAQSHRAAERPA